MAGPPVTLPRRSTVGALVVLLGLAMLGRSLWSRPRILVLHSLRSEDPWVAGVDEGIRSVLAANRRPVSVTWHSMGLDRRTGADARRVAAEDAKREIALLRPDLLIAVDDESNELVGREVARAGRTRVLYASIDRSPANYGYGPGVAATGVAESLPLAGVRDAISALHSGRAVRLAAIAADGETGRAELEQVRAFDWSPHRLVGAEAVGSFGLWQERASGSDADVLVVLSTAGLPRSVPDAARGAIEVVPAAEVVSWTEARSRAVPIGTWPGWVALGGALSIAPPAGPTGRLAMEMALAWLDERDGSEPPPPVRTGHFDVALDASRLAARGFALPGVWVEAARLGDAARP